MIDLDRYEYEYDHELEHGNRLAHKMNRKKVRPNHRPKRTREEIVAELADRDDSLAESFDTTYTPARHERVWLAEALGELYRMGDITDIVRMVKGGKEATVYQCAASPALGAPFVAAKVYRPRRFRNLRNDAQYRHGRKILDADGKELRDERALHAIVTGTDIGKDLVHVSWMAHEVATLEALHAAGAPVPRPIASGPNVILMTYVGDADRPAPTLENVHLTADEAARAFLRLVDTVDLMLARGVVHGDLSAYNVLYWEGDVTLIDFPQAVDPTGNPAARAIFERDVRRLCDHFGRLGVPSDPAALADAIWRRHVPADTWLEHRPEFQAAELEAERARREDDEDR